MRLIARVGLSVLIAPLLAFLVALPGGAEEPSISLSVHLGYRDIVRPGQWMPVTVDATNNGQDFAGTLEVEAQDATGGFGKGIPVPAPGVAGPRSTAVFQLPVTVPAGATKHFRTYLLTDNPGATVAARLIREGRTMTSQTVTPANTTSMLVGVLSDQANAFDDFGAVRLTANSPTLQVAHLQREELADSGILLRAFDLLAIDDMATDGLTAGQRNALADYVANGGNLLLGTGASWRKTLAGVPAVLLPLHVDGTASLVRTTALPGAGSLEIATGGSSSGDTWLSDGSRPLLLEMAVGQGLVTLATFDWTQEPIASWSGTRPLLRQVAIRSLLRGTNAAATGFGVGGMGSGIVFAGPVITTPYGSQGSLTQRSNMLLPALGNVPALDLPPLRVTGLLVLLYILIIGPLNFLVLRLAGRLELAWLTVPVLATIFAGGAYGIGLGTKGRAVQSNQVSVVHLIPGWKSAYRETYTGIFTPTRGDFTVRLADRSLIAPIVTYGPSGPITGGVRIRPDQGSVDLLGVTAFTLRGFATESMVSFSGLSANVRLVEGKLSGQLQNHSSIRFSDVVVIAGDNFQSLGALAPGASAQISLDPSVSSTVPGPPIFTRIYSPIPQAGQAAQRETIQRQQILQMMLGYSGPATRVAPAVIAWTSEPLEAITVNGHSPKAHAQNAVVLPLSIDEFAAGPLPAGLITPRLIDTTGEVTVNPGGIYVRDGSATFEFRLPGLGPRLSEAGIHSSANPYGAKFAPSVTGPAAPISTAFQSEVWDWSRSSWRSISLKDRDTTAIPDAAIDTATGIIRLRVHSVSASVFQLGNLSLTGTLR